MIKFLSIIKSLFLLVVLLFSLTNCKHKKVTQSTPTPIVEPIATEDTTNLKCRLDYKNSKALIKYLKENDI